MSKKHPSVKMTGPGSKHEEAVAALIRRSISAPGIFHPNNWKGGIEPADIILLVRRVLFFINGYEGTKGTDYGLAHNLGQARKRITDWRHGPSIKGRNHYQQFDISWSDVDHIIVVSVIDNPDDLCLVQDSSVIGHSDKVALTFSITSRVLKFLADEGGGSRELLSIGRFLKEEKRPLASDECIGALEASKIVAFRRFALAVQRGEIPTVFELDGKQIPVFEFLYRTFLSFRLHKGDPLDVFLELSWSEIGFIAALVSEATWNIDTARHREKTIDFLMVPHRDGSRFGVVVARTDSILAEQIQRIIEFQDREHLAFMFMGCLSNQMFNTTISVSPEESFSPLADELVEIKGTGQP